MRIPERFNFNESDFCLEMLPFRLKCFCACDKLKSDILKFPFEYEIKAGEMFQILSSYNNGRLCDIEINYTGIPC